MKRVKLEFDREVTISDSAFEQIAAIVKANKVCERCHQAYSIDNNPNVELNRCLRCFLAYHQNRFTFIKLYEVGASGDAIYWFLDGLDTIYYTKSSSKEPLQDYYYTLLHFGFPVPQTYEEEGVVKEISRFHWSIYGNQKTDQVLLIHSTLDYGSTKSVDFLTWRNTDKTMQIDRRRGEGRRLFAAAKKRIEATYYDHNYHIGVHSFTSLDTYWLRIVVANIANEEYERQAEKDGKK